MTDTKRLTYREESLLTQRSATVECTPEWFDYVSKLSWLSHEEEYVQFTFYLDPFVYYTSFLRPFDLLHVGILVTDAT